MKFIVKCQVPTSSGKTVDYRWEYDQEEAAWEKFRKIAEEGSITCSVSLFRLDGAREIHVETKKRYA